MTTNRRGTVGDKGCALVAVLMKTKAKDEMLYGFFPFPFILALVYRLLRTIIIVVPPPLQRLQDVAGAVDREHAQRDFGTNVTDSSATNK